MSQSPTEISLELGEVQGSVAGVVWCSECSEPLTEKNSSPRSAKPQGYSGGFLVGFIRLY